MQREARELVRELGLADVVEIAAFVRDPAELYATSDLVVIPSQGPEVGLPAIEAAASGVAAAVTGTATGAGVVVPGKTGLVAGRDPESIAAAIVRLAADGELREGLGAAARKHAEERFDPARNAARVAELYRTLL